jgi:hypothetical protein
VALSVNLAAVASFSGQLLCLRRPSAVRALVGGTLGGNWRAGSTSTLRWTVIALRVDRGGELFRAEFVFKQKGGKLEEISLV